MPCTKYSTEYKTNNYEQGVLYIMGFNYPVAYNWVSCSSQLGLLNPMFKTVSQWYRFHKHCENLSSVIVGTNMNLWYSLTIVW